MMEGAGAAHPGLTLLCWGVSPRWALGPGLQGWQSGDPWDKGPALELQHCGGRLVPGPGEQKLACAAESHAGAALCGHPCHAFIDDLEQSKPQVLFASAVA